MKRGFTLVALPLVLLGSIYTFGPKASFPEFEDTIPALNMSLDELESYIARKESTVIGLKPDNQARVIWADSVRQTEYSVVYLHGFSASGLEGDPIHFDFAKRFGCNLYLSRLSGHGIDSRDAFADLTPQQLIDSASEALAIGQLIGKKVIVMSTSTGGTLSIFLAATNPDAVHAQILFSPNIQLYSQAADLLTYPWGLEIGKLVEGERRHLDHLKGEVRNYWTTTYRLEGLVALKYLMERTMTTSTFGQVTQPLFLGYYYKDEEQHDHIVSVPAMKEFFAEVGTDEQKKIKKAFPNAGHHVLCSKFHSKSLKEVRQEVFRFAEEVLGM